MLKIAYNSLCSLAFMHQSNIMHRDIKSANIILNSDCSARICDFGLARTLPFQGEEDEMSTINVRVRANKNEKDQGLNGQGDENENKDT